MGTDKNALFTIDFTNNKITDAGVSRPMRAKERSLLDYFVTNNGQLLSLDQIACAVWGADGCSDANIQDTVSKMRNRFPTVKDCIETIKGIGYRFHLPPDSIVIPSADAPAADEFQLPHLLTKTAVSLETRKSVLHRESDIRALEQLLAEGESALLLSGPGGVGKSSLARLLYARLSLQYSSVGWVQYHQNLRSSLLASLDLYDSTDDADKRWACIAKCLRNNLSSKLFIIDNVDFNRFQEQDPLRDALLQEITGWPNTTVILTSRTSEIPGYYSVPIHYLGDEQHPEPCADLFYHYYDRSELDHPTAKRHGANAVSRLIKRAGYHTYAIELLARSAKYEDNLDDFADRIERLGFRFPDQRFFTNNRSAVATAAEQLRLLFARQERSAAEQKILWDFSILPENTTLSAKEVRQLLGYSTNDLEPLCRDSWLLFERAQGFHIHPLVQEVFQFDLQKEKMPHGLGERLFSLIRDRSLIAADEPQDSVQKKLAIAEHIAKYIPVSDTERYAPFYYGLGLLEFDYARKRLTAVSCLRQAYASWTIAAERGEDGWTEHIARSAYQLGYIESTTEKHRSGAHRPLRNALDIWQSLGGHERELADAHDHLGYVLSDDESSFPEAHEHLMQAMAIRKKFVEHAPTEENLRSWATTCDNLGCLYAKWPEKVSLAEPLLVQAYTIRERIYRQTGRHITDAAWTAFNLGRFLRRFPDRFADAERYLHEALEMRRAQELRHPGMYTANLVFTLTTLATLLASDPQRFDQVRALTDEALRLQATIDRQHTGFSLPEIEADLKYLCAFIRKPTVS